MKAETQFKKVLQGSLGNLFNHYLKFYLKTRCFFPKNLFNHSVRESRNLPKIGLVRFIHIAALYELSWPAQEIPLGQSSHLRTMTTFVITHVKDLFVTCFGPTEISSHGNIRLVLAHLRN
jgi:hypothetical protein